MIIFAIANITYGLPGKNMQNIINYFIISIKMATFSGFYSKFRKRNVKSQIAKTSPNLNCMIIFKSIVVQLCKKQQKDLVHSYLFHSEDLDTQEERDRGQNRFETNLQRWQLLQLVKYSAKYRLGTIKKADRGSKNKTKTN